MACLVLQDHHCGFAHNYFFFTEFKRNFISFLYLNYKRETKFNMFTLGVPIHVHKHLSKNTCRLEKYYTGNLLLKTLKFCPHTLYIFMLLMSCGECFVRKVSPVCSSETWVNLAKNTDRHFVCCKNRCNGLDF